MLTENQKRKVEQYFSMHVWFAVRFGTKSFQAYPAPQLACVYAFEMSDDTVKIGVSKDTQKRAKGVKAAVYLDVLRVHQTGVAPFGFMRSLESRCHAAFDDRRVRGEFFNITFEEAVAELDSHAAEIVDALHKADRRYIEELNYYNELVAKYQEENARLEPDSVVQNLSVVYVLRMDNGTTRFGVTENLNETIWQTVGETNIHVNEFYTTRFMSQETAELIEALLDEKLDKYLLEGEFFNVPFETAKAELDKISFLMEEEILDVVSEPDEEFDLARTKLLVELCNAQLDSPFKEQLAKETANLLLGEKIF